MISWLAGTSVGISSRHTVGVEVTLVVLAGVIDSTGETIAQKPSVADTLIANRAAGILHTASITVTSIVKAWVLS